MNSANSNVKVFIRFRPICAAKIEQPFDYEFNKNEILIRKTNNQSRSYCFDGIFDDQSKQQDLSESIIDPLIQQVREGFNCTVLAYGQTGTGKTYTIEGEYLNDVKNHEESLSTNHQSTNQQLPNNAGLVPRAFNKLFNLLTTEDQFKVSAIEIYNEEIFDLLSDNSDPLRIYENHKGVTLNNLKEFLIKDANDLNIILQKTNSKRQFASTLMNKRSSRSHVIFQFTFHTKETLENNHVVEKVGKLNLVDLAGSECAKRTGCQQDIRALEAGNINRSLLTLTRVIDALVKNQKYIPFRNSNLTRIIQDTLGGNSKTVLIATLSPALIDFEDTLNTLTFAATVKHVKNNASANVKIIQNNYFEERLKELEENLLLEQSKHDEEQAQLKLKLELLKTNHETELKSKDDDLEELENLIENKDNEIMNLKRSINRLNKELENKTLQKENDIKEPANKRQRTSIRPLSNTVNGRLTRLSNADDDCELTKSFKNDLNIIFKDCNLMTRKLNKMKTLNTNQENLLKALTNKNKDNKIGSNLDLEENLSTFLQTMFNFTIRDEFETFLEYLMSIVDPESLEDLEEKFNNFNRDIYDKLDFVKETVDSTVNLKDEELKKKIQAINELNEMTNELKKESAESVKIFKKLKDKVKSLKNSTK